jgi:peptidoglycan/xylan/chitin deacetylase (PgdA/CDA1 family)
MRSVPSTLAALLLCAAAATAAAPPPKLKIALTFDDLPINGTLAAGAKQSDYARDTVAVLKQHHVPPSFGFINAKKLERNPDGALALQIWVAGGNPVANHTYSHIDLTKNSAEDFERDVLLNEPALELLMPEGAKSSWRWFRYPYLHEGDTLEKRRAVRAFLASNGYRIAQTTIDWEDYLWNSAHARCVMKNDAQAIDWLRESYLSAAQAYLAMQRDLARQVFGRDINHVMLLHLGSFSSHILPDLFSLLSKEGYEIVTLEEAHRDPVYESDPDVASPGGGTLTDLMIEAKPIPYPNFPGKPRERLATICQ